MVRAVAAAATSARALRGALAGVCLLLPAAVPAVAGDTVLARLATSLAGAPEPVRADFAAVALGEVLAAHEQELERLSAPGQVSRRELAKQARWARALEEYLAGMYAARDAVDAGQAVEIRVAPPEPVQLLVGRQLVPLTSPRIDNPAALDESIVHVYCETFACDPQVLGSRPPPPPVLLAASGGWSFQDGPTTYETADGLGFIFPDASDRAAKERAVAEVHREFRRLVQVVANAERSGRAVDYDLLEVRDSGRGDDHRVILVRGGTGIRAFLPLLAQSPELVALARPWIRARVRGVSYRQVFPRADLLLPGLL